jgi:mono/diheme cytochrome c family protein
MVTFFARVGLALALWATLLPWAHSSPFEDTLAQRTRACTACHGDQGRAGPDGYYPRLAGKPAGYLYNQLTHFQQGRRHYTPMLHLIDPLSDTYLREIAEHFASLALPYPAPKPSDAPSAVLARGQLLAQQGDKTLGLPACIQCHGTALTGVLPATPGLLGLPRDYLNAQLGGWQTGQRHAHAPDCMAGIAKKLSADDANAVATWLSTQAVPNNSKPALTRPVWPQGVKEPVCGPATPPEAKAPAMAKPPAASAVVARGAYLARIGNCAVCHTARSGEPYAGGRGIDTPFGTVYSTNLTSDAATGLGQWNAQDFWQALHHGKSRDGRWLNPAFPYTSYTHVSREDADALFAFLQTLRPVSRAPTAHALTWPLGSQVALGAWRALYFTPATAPQDRGAYLVKGLGHCAECHTRRNALGGLASEGLHTSGVLPRSQWLAPALVGNDGRGGAALSEHDMVQFLMTGMAGNRVAAGPMAEVVLHGTQYLSNADAQAMAQYLNSLPDSAGTTTTSAPTLLAAASGVAFKRGGAIYEKHCQDCHGKLGVGQAGAYPALAGNRAVTAANINNLVLTVLNGGFAPATAGNPRPFGMPGFLLTLNDAEVAAVLTYIRASWGNAGTAVNEFDINKLRSALSH